MNETIKSIRAASKLRTEATAKADAEIEQLLKARREYQAAWEAAAVACEAIDDRAKYDAAPFAALAKAISLAHRDAILSELSGAVDSPAIAGEWLILEAIRLFGEGKERQARTLITERMRLDTPHSLRKSLWDVFGRFHAMQRAERAPARKAKPKAAIKTKAKLGRKPGSTTQAIIDCVDEGMSNGDIAMKLKTSAGNVRRVRSLHLNPPQTK